MSVFNTNIDETLLKNHQLSSGAEILSYKEGKLKLDVGNYAPLYYTDLIEIPKLANDALVECKEVQFFPGSEKILNLKGIKGIDCDVMEFWILPYASKLKLNNFNINCNCFSFKYKTRNDYPTTKKLLELNNTNIEPDTYVWQNDRMSMHKNNSRFSPTYVVIEAHSNFIMEKCRELKYGVGRFRNNPDINTILRKFDLPFIDTDRLKGVFINKDYILFKKGTWIEDKINKEYPGGYYFGTYGDYLITEIYYRNQWGYKIHYGFTGGCYGRSIGYHGYSL